MPRNESTNGPPVSSYVAALEHLCASRLTQITAIDDRGLFVPIPEGFDIASATPLSARSMLDVVASGSRVAVIDAWDRARAEGGARTKVELRGGAPAELFFFDLRSLHGVYVGALVSQSEIEAATRAEYAEPPPRLSMQRKNETARFIEVDDATVKMLGWRPEEMIGHGSLEFVHPDDHDRAIESWMDMLGQPGAALRARLRYRHADGSYMWLELTNRNLLDDPEHRCVVTEALNVDDEMAAHEVVRAREELLRGIAEAVPLGLAHLDVTGDLVYSNDQFHELLATARKPEDGDCFRNIVAEDRVHFDTCLRDVLATGADRELEVRISGRRRTDWRYCDIRLRPLHDSAAVVTGAIVCIEDVTERVHAREELEQRATVDALTKCENRASILSHLAQFAEVGSPVAVVFVDLDGFKDVNDCYGHAAGDALLVAVADRLRACTRKDDRIGRLGGDEFLVVCPYTLTRTEVDSVVDRIRTQVTAPIALGDRSIVIDASIGAALARGEWTPDELVAEADAAMYEAKREHRRRRPRER